MFVFFFFNILLSTSTLLFSKKKNSLSSNRFADLHGFSKPNDDRALRLMDAAASDVALALGAAGKKKGKDRRSGSGKDASASTSFSSSTGVVLGFGSSDEYSFVLSPTCEIYERRESKLVSVTASTFAASYVRRWDSFFRSKKRKKGRESDDADKDDEKGDSNDTNDTRLRSTPSFDCRAVLYPTTAHLRDYLSWRQADAHVNCQYNACFWSLVKGSGERNVPPMSRGEAAAALRGTRTAEKNELLFSRFGINYSRLPARHRKGSVLVRRADVLGEEEDRDAEEEGEGEEEEKASGGGDGDGNGDDKDDNDDKDDDGGGDASLKKLAPGWAVIHCDVIKDDFWNARPHLLGGA